MIELFLGWAWIIWNLMSLLNVCRVSKIWNMSALTNNLFISTEGWWWIKFNGSFLIKMRPFIFDKTKSSDFLLQNQRTHSLYKSLYFIKFSRNIVICFESLAFWNFVKRFIVKSRHLTLKRFQKDFWPKEEFLSYTLLNFPFSSKQILYKQKIQ